MTADLHLHTKYSADSEEEPAKIVEAAIGKGIGIICFTDHMDYDFGKEGDAYTFDPDRYFSELEPLADEYRKDIRILIGVEFGMQPHLRSKFEKLIHGWPFDYVLGSQHLVYGADPYYPDVFRGRTDADVIMRWFAELQESLPVFPEISSLAHLDYIFRYAAGGERFTYDDFREPLDSILKELIRRNTSLEINSNGLSRIRCIDHFYESLLAHYAELGGKNVTTGSDAHTAGRVGADFESALELIEEIPGLNYVFYEKQRLKSMYLQQILD